MLAAATAGDPPPSPAKPTPLRIVNIARGSGYQLPVVRATVSADEGAPAQDRRFARSFASAPYQASDPQGDAVRTLLRDRRARRGGALDARVELRLTGSSSDIGLGGGLKRVVDTLLHD